MKLLLLSFIFLLGFIRFIHFGNACCNVTDNNTNVLERAFGPIISAKLEDTCEDIKASFQSGMTEQNAQFTELLDEKTHEFQEVLQSKFVEQRENLKSFNTKLDEQRKGIIVTMGTKFESQDEKIKGLIGDLVHQFTQLLENKLKEQKEDFHQKLEEQKSEFMESMQLLRCPFGWVLVNNSCILVSIETATFQGATEKCKELHINSRLYEPPNMEHNDLVFNLLDETSHWIGIREFEENSWVFLSSNESIPFTHWQNMEPSNGNAGREDCVELGHGIQEPHRHLWNDETCWTQNKFICEIKLSEI